ncbi:hypothetical protein CEUSTIGMA_g2355.t1 [Chlamydomonas eustigma]|uniref:serine O-acetyltransferase n=1 Tax=Chlamydomonas eustigma TaxID=1157962 RepID=A0A250WW22_9CHLO|nr:hypothetical protein CEUSTIGMA_g2355.t1 [Chlamydomonas eustigma]|eukprot:GAX74909.1 hypothetical protein CEUSTIGMA_g2355.t1 [Chlamydomonas eustigma]
MIKHSYYSCTGAHRSRAVECRHCLGTRRVVSFNFQATESNGSSASDDNSTLATGFPSYMQKNQMVKFPCEEGPLEIRNDGTKAKWKSEIAIWESIREEAQRDASSEPLLSSFLYASILAHESFERALAFVLANRLANPTMLPTQLFEIFHGILVSDDNVRCAALADLEACKDRDPACSFLCHALLYFKGYHAIQAHRIAHALWMRNQKVLALALQSRMSEVYAVDIHPAARIGKGILLDHGTGVVIGETAVIGNNCSLLQNVTLGGTGKEVGDRHPKIMNNVLIGASATVLGNIVIGDGAQIAAGSLVLKPVEPHTMVAGSPAKPVGKVMDNPAETMLHWREKNIFPTSTIDESDEGTKVSISNRNKDQQTSVTPLEAGPVASSPSAATVVTPSVSSVGSTTAAAAPVPVPTPVSEPVAMDSNSSLLKGFKTRVPAKDSKSSSSTDVAATETPTSGVEYYI